MSMLMSTNKHKRKGVFDAIDTLESQDAQADKKKKRLLEKDQREAKAAQSQVKIFEHLMEMRILLQRVIMQGECGDSSGDSKEGQPGGQAQNLCHELITKLLHMRRTIVSSSEAGEHDHDYLYHAADTDHHLDLDTTIASEYNAVKDDWKEVLNKRYKDLRLHSGMTAKAQFKLLDSDFWHQVESTASYELNARADGGLAFFDDSKTYQHMLQDFLLGKSKSSSLDIIKRKKTKTSAKVVDRRASKGRKVRYAVIPKLVNFTFPQQRGESSMDEDEWFKSLFGGGQPRN